MRRREFITLLGGAAVAWPLAARAQPSGKLPRIGYLSDEGVTPHLFHSNDWVLDGLHKRGYDEGRNIVIEYRYATGKAEKLPLLAAELTALPVDVILTVGTPATRAALAATKTIPIVFARIGDPVGYGLVASLARPRGNATGVTVFTVELAEKRLQLLSEMALGHTHIAVLHELNFPPGDIELKQFMAVAASLKLQLHAVSVSNLAALQEVLPNLMNESPAALFVGSSALFEDHPQQIVDLALKTRLPALYIRREFAEIGGLISYGVNFRDTYRTAADYIARILNGAKPADLPVQQPVKIEMVINLKTAKALDLTIPSALLARADEVIE
jgi:putative tryptophan/tyrosine transport system substrate-binding protein